MIKPEIEATTHENDEMRPLYDFSKGVRGKHAKVMQSGYTMTIHNPDGTTTFKEVKPPKGTVFLDPDVLAYFADSESVNTTLRALIQIAPKQQSQR